MPSAVRLFLLVACGVFGLPVIAAAQYKVEVSESVERAVATPVVSSGTIVFETFDGPAPPTVPFGGPAPAGGMAYPGSYRTRGMRLPVPVTRSRPAQAQQWSIPTGEYGLELANGMRMVGRPAKDWTARITTTFGAVVIPLAQIAHIAPAGNGQFSAYLKNGDRVTGSLVSNTMTFETKFGPLSIAAADIARLRSSNAAVAPRPVAGTPTPSRPVGVGTSSGVPVGPPGPPRTSSRARRFFDRVKPSPK